jgi:hypothetical protein
MPEPRLAAPSPTGHAPQRRKRHVVIILALGAVVLLAPGLWVGLQVSFAIRAERRLQAAIAEADRLDPDWRLDQLEAKRKPVPDDQNGALVVLAAERLISAEWDKQPLGKELQDQPPAHQLGAELTRSLRAELDKVKPALAEARKLKDLPDGRYPIAWTKEIWGHGGHGSFMTPNVQKPRRVVALLHQDVFLRAQEGDVDAALASCRGIVNAARSLGDEPALLTQMTRLSCTTAALRNIERTLAQGQPSEAALTALQSLLEDEAAQPLLLIGLRGERATWYVFLDAVRAGEIEDAELPKKDAKVLLASALEVNNQLVEIAKLPEVQQGPEFDKLAVTLDKSPESARSAANVLGTMQAVIVFKASQAFLRNKGQLSCTIVALAGERHRHKTRHWPESLAELVPKYLHEVPTDSCDAKPLRYRRLKDGVVIYSVGPDGKDDGGKIDWKNPYVPGTDLGFRLWDVGQRRQPPVSGKGVR